MAWPAVGMPARSSSAFSSPRVSGPRSVSASTITSVPRSAWAGVTPSCFRRRALPVRSGGMVRACSHGSSSVASRCSVPRLHQVTSRLRSSLRACSMSFACAPAVRARTASRGPQILGLDREQVARGGQHVGGRRSRHPLGGQPGAQQLLGRGAHLRHAIGAPSIRSPVVAASR
jgi:hypothetical protein